MGGLPACALRVEILRVLRMENFKMASADPVNFERLIAKLGSKVPAIAKKALATVTKLTRNSESVTKLRVKGGISLLLGFVQRPNRSHVDMALSALANCALDKECRHEVSSEFGHLSQK